MSPHIASCTQEKARPSGRSEREADLPAEMTGGREERTGTGTFRAAKEETARTPHASAGDARAVLGSEDSASNPSRDCREPRAVGGGEGSTLSRGCRKDSDPDCP